MKILKYQLHTRFVTIMLLLSFFLLWQTQTLAQQVNNKDKSQILAMTNWAAINFPNLFPGAYIGPQTGSGYRYTCFGNNCIGIQQQTETVDVLIDGVLSSVGSVESVLNIISISKNGILNLSGESVSNNTIPAIFSPGLGETTAPAGTIISIDWKLVVNPGTDEQEICDFSVIINPAKPETVGNINFTRNLFAGAGLQQWVAFSLSNDGIPGIQIDYENRSLNITENLVLPKIAGGTDDLIIAAGDILRF